MCKGNGREEREVGFRPSGEHILRGEQRTGMSLSVIWIRMDPIILASRIRVAKNQQKSWETRIRIDRNHKNITFFKIEITFLLNAHK